MHLVKMKVSMSRTISKIVDSVTRNLQVLGVQNTALSSYCHYYWNMHRSFTVPTGDWWQQLMRHFKERTVEYIDHSSRFLSHRVRRPREVRSCLSSGNIPAIRTISFMRNSHPSHTGIRTKQHTVFFVAYRNNKLKSFKYILKQTKMVCTILVDTVLIS